MPARGLNDFRAPLTQWYASSFVARPGWTPIRLPFSSFRALEGDNAQLTLDPSDISALVRFPARNARLASALSVDAFPPAMQGFRFDSRGQPKRAGSASAASEGDNSFNLEVRDLAPGRDLVCDLICS